MWAYVEGGMGSITRALAKSAKAAGATIVTDCVVDEILTEGGKAIGVSAALAEGPTPLLAHTVLTNATPHHTFMDLVRDGAWAGDVEGRSRGMTRALTLALALSLTLALTTPHRHRQSPAARISEAH